MRLRSIQPENNQSNVISINVFGVPWSMLTLSLGRDVGLGVCAVCRSLASPPSIFVVASPIAAHSQFASLPHTPLTHTHTHTKLPPHTSHQLPSIIYKSSSPSVSVVSLLCRACRWLSAGPGPLTPAAAMSGSRGGFSNTPRYTTA